MKQRILIFLACIIFFAPLQASDIHPLKLTLTLDAIKSIQTQELAGDELYFDVAAYQPGQTKTYKRIPEEPHHFASKHADNIKALPLWTGELKPGETTTLTVSLMEKDRTKINPDDVIGAFRIYLTNEKGLLNQQWHLGENINQTGKNNELLDIKGKKGAHYQLKLSFTN